MKYASISEQDHIFDRRLIFLLQGKKCDSSASAFVVTDNKSNMQKALGRPVDSLLAKLSLPWIHREIPSQIAYHIGSHSTG